MSEPVDGTNVGATAAGEQAGRALAPAARRALAEAEARRGEAEARAAALAAEPEVAGRGGLDPVRYDDWEIGGRAVDF